MCLFDMILGSQFLTETQTLSKYAYRISNCISPRPFQFCLLGKSSSSIIGSLGLWRDVFALLDTGAECNVIDYQWVLLPSFVGNSNTLLLIITQLRKMPWTCYRLHPQSSELSYLCGRQYSTNSRANTCTLDFCWWKANSSYFWSSGELRIQHCTRRRGCLQAKCIWGLC